MIEGLIRVAVLIGYILVISLLPDLRRVFQYHGAEHKTIHALEAGEELTTANVQKHSLIHPRCGTAFLLYVMVIAIFVFAFVGRPEWYWLILSRIALLPLIAGLAYEVIRYAGKHQGNRALMTLLAPGMWLQRLTTRQPTDEQVEVSIRALERVLERDKAETPEEQKLDTKVEVMAVAAWGNPAADRPTSRRHLGGNHRERRGSGVGDELRRVRVALHHRLARGGSGRKDEPGGARGGGARVVLRHVARQRARARGHAARAHGGPVHHHDGPGRER